MSHSITIQSLPNEMLECIFHHLDWYDLQVAMLVCKRWAPLAFDNGSNTVLKIYGSEEAYHNRTDDWMIDTFEEMSEALLLSQRPYKHLVVVWDSANEETILSILDRFGQSVESLKIQPGVGLVEVESLPKILRYFPNLNHLDAHDVIIDDYDPEVGDFVFRGPIRLEPMRKLRSLYDRALQVNVENSEDVFGNITELRSWDIYTIPFVRQLSPQLVYLAVHERWNEFNFFSDEQFPMLETVELTWDCESYDTPYEHIGRFFENCPKLKNLILQDSIDIPLLRLLDPLQNTLQSLTIHVGRVEYETLQIIEKLKNLKQLHINCGSLQYQPFVNAPLLLRNIRKLKLQRRVSAPVSSIIGCFPNLADLEFSMHSRDEDQCEAIVNQLPALKRLVIRWMKCFELETFVELCRQLKVPELHFYCSKLKNTNWDSSKQLSKIPHLQKLFLQTSSIHAYVYVPMLESMPALRRLELALQKPCKNKILQTLLAKFPQCTFVQKRYQAAAYYN